MDTVVRLISIRQFTGILPQPPAGASISPDPCSGRGTPLRRERIGCTNSSLGNRPADDAPERTWSGSPPSPLPPPTRPVTRQPRPTPPPPVTPPPAPTP